jgi:hypothetical protein
MARFGVRSGSLAFARPIGNPETKRLERTDANRSERSLAFAMQKAVGSNPIIRLYTLQNGIFGCLFRQQMTFCTRRETS